MKNIHRQSFRYIGGTTGSRYAPSYLRYSPSSLTEDDMAHDDDDKLPEKSDPDTNHASVLELSGEFFLNGAVTPESMLKLSQAMLRVAQMKAKKSRINKTQLTLNINSYGGNVDAGLMLCGIINRIREEYGCHITTRIVGEAGSMAFVLSQVGDLRIADTYSSFMMHDVQAGTGYGDTQERFRREKGVTLLRLTVAKILSERNTKGHNDPEWWIKNFMDRENYLSAQEALELGVVDSIVGGPKR